MSVLNPPQNQQYLPLLLALPDEAYSNTQSNASIKNKQDCSPCLSKPWEKLWKPKGKGRQKQPASELMNFVAGSHRSVSSVTGCHSAPTTCTERNYLGLHRDSGKSNQPSVDWCSGSRGSAVLLHTNSSIIKSCQQDHTLTSIHQKANVTYIFFFFTAPSCTRAAKAFFCMSEDSAS